MERAGLRGKLVKHKSERIRLTMCGCRPTFFAGGGALLLASSLGGSKIPQGRIDMEAKGAEVGQRFGRNSK